MRTHDNRTPVTIDGYTSEVASWAVALPDHGIVGRGDPTVPGDPVELDPRTILGRKGLRYLSPASVLAGCAAALALAGRAEPDAGTGIVAASRYGHLRTVCRSATVFADGRAQDASPMELPNASMNVLASTIALRHRITGVCLTVDSSEGAGDDVLVWAHRLLRSGRCRRVLVVAAEEPCAQDEAFRSPGRELLRGAVALVLEGGASSDAPTVPAVSGYWWDRYDLGALSGPLGVLARVSAAERSRVLVGAPA